MDGTRRVVDVGPVAERPAGTRVRDRPPIELDQDHVVLGVLVDEVREVVADVVERRQPLDPIGAPPGVEHLHDRGQVVRAGVAPEAKAGDPRCLGHVQPVHVGGNCATACVRSPVGHRRPPVPFVSRRTRPLLRGPGHSRPLRRDAGVVGLRPAAAQLADVERRHRPPGDEERADARGEDDPEDELEAALRSLRASRRAPPAPASHGRTDPARRPEWVPTAAVRMPPIRPRPMEPPIERLRTGRGPSWCHAGSRPRSPASTP